jgi:hypothetical protein
MASTAKSNTMNTRQLVILWIGIAIAVAMLVYPPYLTAGTNHPLHYGLLLSPPSLVSKEASGLLGALAAASPPVPAPLDAPVLLAELGIVILVALGLLLTLQDKHELHGR